MTESAKSTGYERRISEHNTHAAKKPQAVNEIKGIYAK